MNPPKVLIADSISQRGVDELSRDGALEVSAKTGLSETDLVKIIPDFSAIVVRSQTKVTGAILNAATRLRVVGRAGVGVDNVDVSDTATRRGVIVMNAPGGNTISTAEHAFSLLLCVARKIPAADAMIHGGSWNRKNLEGVELYNKTLGIIGMGRIGSELSRRAIAFGMRVLAFDPYLSASRARSLQVELVEEIDELLAAADFISLHTPLTAETRHILNAERLAKTKRGVRIINCARGGLIDEQAIGRCYIEWSRRRRRARRFRNRTVASRFAAAKNPQSRFDAASRCFDRRSAGKRWNRNRAVDSGGLARGDNPQCRQYADA